jgi:hypothetical protein
VLPAEQAEGTGHDRDFATQIEQGVLG